MTEKDPLQRAHPIYSVVPKIIVVIMAGTRVNFYEQLKRYMKG